jgi:hypothetical protein
MGLSFQHKELFMALFPFLNNFSFCCEIYNGYLMYVHISSPHVCVPSSNCSYVLLRLNEQEFEISIMHVSLVLNSYSFLRSSNLHL